MVLRPKKSISKLSSLFGRTSASKKIPGSNHTSHLIWILLSSTSRGPQYGNVYDSSMDALVKSITQEKGVHSVTRLKNTSPACTFGTGSNASTPRASSISLLVKVSGENSFLLLLENLHALLESVDIPSKLQYTLNPYKLTQPYEPRQTQKVASKCTVAVAIEPSTGQDEEIDAWYREEHLRMLATNSLFLRCYRYERIVDTEGTRPSAAHKFLALHEYTSVQDLFDHSIQTGRLIEETEWTRRVLDGAKAVERSIWTMV